MRILFVSHLFLPRNFGGTEVYTFNIASEMKRRGHDVSVLTCESFKTGQRNEVRALDDVHEGLDIHRIFLNIRLMDDPVRAEYFNPFVEQHLLDYYREIRPDVVHVHHACYLSTAVITAAQKLNIPTAFTATDFWMICPDSQLLRWDGSLCDGPTNIADCLRCYTHLSTRAKKYRWAMKSLPDGLVKQLVKSSERFGSTLLWQFRVLHAANHRAEWNRAIFNSVGLFISPSRFLETMFLRNGLTNPHRAFAPFGVSSSMVETKTQKKPSAVLRFGFIGTISKHKGLHVLIEAFRELKESEPAQLIVHGGLQFDPPYGRRILRLANGCSRIHFAGTFPHEQMSEVFRGIDVLVVPSSWYENTPLVIYSALAMETPVICSNLGGMAEVIQPGKNGLTFEAENSKALAACLRQFIEQPDLVNRLRPDRSRIQTIEDNARQLETLYDTLLGRAPSLPLAKSAAQGV